LVRLLFYKMPLLETIAYPRVHHQLMPDVLEIESYKLVGNQTIGILQNTNGYETIESVGKAVLNGIHRTDRNEIHAVGDYWRKRCSGDIVLVKS
jgi:gamma-glutamyltranspeptidase / glutathione hydrolase